jgi:hypothetical protein
LIPERLLGFAWGALFGVSAYRVYEGETQAWIFVIGTAIGCLIFGRIHGKAHPDQT